MIHLRNVTFGYHRVPVIHCASFAVTVGQCVGIYGANGSGKSTLLRGIAGVLAPLSGTVDRDRSAVISLVPQRQAIDPSWPMTAFDAAALASSAQATCGWLGGRKRLIHAAMEQLNVTKLARRPFSQLSGGQQQRVLLAGALACRPKILLLDEPAEGLDAASTQSLLDLLRGLVNDGTAVVIISHESAELSRVADTFAWVEVAGAAGVANELTLLPREAFLDRATGGRGEGVISSLHTAGLAKAAGAA